MQDSQDDNPLIRALAVRTMGCIRVDKITEYLCDPLLRTLRDADPYVRKTAAICVAKLYDINPELVEERGFLDMLRELIGDANPMVVANAVAALSEIADASGRRDVLQITSAVLFKLLAALNECTEWGQVFILDALAGHSAASSADAEAIVERVTPRLQHANCAVVLSAVKVILKQLPLLGGNAELMASLRKKLAPPLVTLLSAEPEIQYVALRNINLIIQRYPAILGGEVKVFFCKYNDPLYVKMEKLELMVRLASDRTIDAVLLEWREYATEVDVDFVRKAVRAIGRAAIALPAAAERCVAVLLDLIQTKVSYVVQEAVVVIRDIFRRYPGAYEGVIGTLCDCLDTLDEPEAKASMVWIVGEYAERIDNAEDLLRLFGETFEEEAPAVQLQLLTAAVKLFLKKPEAGPQALIQELLGKATTETDNPDLRDRAYIYWRLLAADPEAARDVVLAERPVIADDAAALEPALLDELLGQVATLASVYHKPAESFVSRARAATQGTGLGEGDDEEGAEATAAVAAAYAAELQQQQQAAPGRSAQPDLMGDLMGLDTPVAAPAAASAPGGGGDLLGDLMSLNVGGSTAPPAQAAPALPPLPVVLPASAANGGLEISGALVRGAGGAPVLALTFACRGGAEALDGLQLQLNKNCAGLALAAPLALPALAPGGAAVPAMLPLTASAPPPPPAPRALQLAVKSPRSPAPGVFYFAVALAVEEIFAPGGLGKDMNTLAAAWRALPDLPPAAAPAALFRDAADASARLGAAHVVVAHVRPLADGAFTLYAGALLPPATQVVVELTARGGAPGARLAAKSTAPDAAAVTLEALQRLLA